MKTVYLDHSATTPIDPRVTEVMLPWLKEDFGNPSSIHAIGRKANVAVEEAREKIAHYLGAEPSEIVFTSGGTESDNAAVKGALRATGKKHLISSGVEHHAILHPLENAEKEGVETTWLPVQGDGTVTPEQVREAITSGTALVTLMHVNNETGAINPVTGIAQVCREHGIPLHTDAVQSVGKLPVNVDDLNVDLMTLSAHKIYGPKGVGALYIRSGTQWEAWMEGGSQERYRRGGTLNVPGIVGFAKALELSVEEMASNQRHIGEVQQRLYRQLENAFPELIRFNSDPEKGIHHLVNCSFRPEGDKALDGEMLLLNLDIEGIYCSNGSACTSGAIEPSHVLMELGIPPETAKSSLRFSLGKDNTVEEMDHTVVKLEGIVHRMLETA